MPLWSAFVPCMVYSIVLLISALLTECLFSMQKGMAGVLSNDFRIHRKMTRHSDLLG